MRAIEFLVVFLALPGVAMAALTDAERKSQFEPAMASIIAATTPTVFGFVRDTLIKDCLACKPNRGQAVELVHESYFRSCEHDGDPALGQAVHLRGRPEPERCPGLRVCQM